MKILALSIFLSLLCVSQAQTLLASENIDEKAVASTKRHDSKGPSDSDEPAVLGEEPPPQEYVNQIGDDISMSSDNPQL